MLLNRKGFAMTITLEQIQELRKGITPGEWQFSESQIESSTDDGFQDVIPTTGCLVCEDGYCELDISYDEPNVKAIALVPELLHMAERCLQLEARLTPSEETKKMFMGEFRFTSRSHTDELGEDVLVDQEVPWVAIKEIMKAISSGAEMKS